jgi:hypothetical protein
MTRILLAVFFLFWMALAMFMNVPHEWDIFDIAAIILGITVCGVLVSDIK